MHCDTFGKPCYIYITYISIKYAETHSLNFLKKQWSCVNALFPASKSGRPNIIKSMVLVSEAILLTFSKLLSIQGCTFLNVPLAVLIWLGWADPQHSLVGVSLLQRFPKSFPTQTAVQLAALYLTFTTTSHLTVIHSTCTKDIYRTRCSSGTVQQQQQPRHQWWNMSCWAGGKAKQPEGLWENV